VRHARGPSSSMPLCLGREAPGSRARRSRSVASRAQHRFRGATTGSRPSVGQVARAAACSRSRQPRIGAKARSATARRPPTLDPGGAAWRSRLRASPAGAFALAERPLFGPALTGQLRLAERGEWGVRRSRASGTGPSAARTGTRW
jgi:hypothetical protein